MYYSALDDDVSLYVCLSVFPFFCPQLCIYMRLVRKLDRVCSYATTSLLFQFNRNSDFFMDKVFSLFVWLAFHKSAKISYIAHRCLRIAQSTNSKCALLLYCLAPKVLLVSGQQSRLSVPCLRFTWNRNAVSKFIGDTMQDTSNITATLTRLNDHQVEIRKEPTVTVNINVQ